MVDAEGGRTEYAYDEAGNLLSQKDAEGRITRYGWDSLRRRVKRTLPLGMSERYRYDTADRLAGRTDFNGFETTFQYDAMDRLLARIPDSRMGEQSVNYTYTPTGQRASMEDAVGYTGYAYDSRDRLVLKASPQGTLLYTYDQRGNLTRMYSDTPGGVNTQYDYDALSRLAVVSDAHTTGTTTYDYDAV